jgi:hypothetical protein
MIDRVLTAGGATSIGSLPHADPAEAAAFVLAHQPELPAAPSLPSRSPMEQMVAQAAFGIRGVRVGPDGSLSVDPALLDPAAPVLGGVHGDGFVGLRVFLDAVAGRTDPVKLQLTGPVTLGIALAAAGAPAPVAFDVAGAAVRAMVEAARAAVPEAPLVVFLDEPGLTACVRTDFPLHLDDTIDLVSGALAVLEPVAFTGVHCCGPTDWRVVALAGPRILSLPLDAGVLDAAGTLGSFLDGGGWIAWGAVPTSGPVGDDGDLLWRRLAGLWCDLVRAGCDPGRLRTQSLVTPACGLALHDVHQAAHILDLTRTVAERAADQATGARLSVGA